MAQAIAQAHPFIGSSVANLLATRRDRLAFFQELARSQGDIVRFRLGPREVWLLSHPDDIRDVLVTRQRQFIKSPTLQVAKHLLGEGLLTSEGETHLKQRRLMQPAFHRQRVAAYADTMVRYAALTRERWAGLPPVEPLDMAQEMMRLTLVIAGKTLFDADVEDDTNEVREVLRELMSLFQKIAMPWSALTMKLPLPSTIRFRKARRRLDEIIYRIIRERRQSGQDHHDLLSMLLTARDEEGETGGMSDEQVRDEVLTLFLAGHETTAIALTWTWYLLSQHPTAEAKLHAEIDTALEGRLPTFEDVPKLRYTEMCFAEAMRLYPPAWIIGRQTLADYEVRGCVIPKGATVLMSPYIVQHDPRFYPAPEKYDPERFAPETKEARPKFAYFPFGGGTRVCIGEPFAWLEGVLALATLAQRWKPRLVPGHPVEIMPFATLRPKHGMMMTLEHRRDHCQREVR